MLIIAAALSGQDVRDRPQEQAQAADEKHKPFDDERSEFMGYLKLWKWIEEGRGHGEAPAHGSTPPTSSATASRNSACATASSARAACANGATSIRSCTPWWPSMAGA